MTAAIKQPNAWHLHASKANGGGNRASLYLGDGIGGLAQLDVDGDTVDHIITDPPYDEVTHGGHNAGITDVNANGPIQRRTIDYAPLSNDEAAGWCAIACHVARGWICILTSHFHAPIYARTMKDHGRYVFAPIPVVKIGGRVRLVGDGPSNWTVWLVVSRPRKVPYSRWGTLRGAYITSRPITKLEVPGGKDFQQMVPIVKDYSREGDLVCDPFAGAATTGCAALSLGRRFVGWELDAETFNLAARRLASRPRAVQDQGELFNG